MGDVDSNEGIYILVSSTTLNRSRPTTHTKFDPTSRSWPYIPCQWDTCSNHSAISCLSLLSPVSYLTLMLFYICSSSDIVRIYKCASGITQTVECLARWELYTGIQVSTFGHRSVYYNDMDRRFPEFYLSSPTICFSSGRLDFHASLCIKVNITTYQLTIKIMFT